MASCALDLKQAVIMYGKNFEGPRAVDGIFLGYKVLPGGKCVGEYYVSKTLEMAEHCNSRRRKVRVYTVRELFWDREAEFTFPIAKLRPKGWKCKPEPSEFYEDPFDEIDEDQGGDFGELEEQLFKECERELDRREKKLTHPAHDTDVETSGTDADAKEDALLDYPRPDMRGKPGWVAGRYVRGYRGTFRPPDILPEVWDALGRDHKRALAHIYEDSLYAEPKPEGKKHKRKMLK